MVRLNVTSRKLMVCLFASIVIRSPLSLKMRHMSFLMFSVAFGVASVMASPSSTRFCAVITSHGHVKSCRTFLLP